MKGDPTILVQLVRDITTNIPTIAELDQTMPGLTTADQITNG